MSGLVSCPTCGRPQAIGNPFCAHCGSPLPGLGTGYLPPNFTLQAGRYIILHTVGRGGMGAVYKATDTRLGGKVVAIKEMSDAAIANPQQRSMATIAFDHEANMLARLDHPNIPKVIDSFHENQKLYMVMEFVQGKTLEDFLQGQAHPVAEGQVRMWAERLCDVLGYLHRQQPPVIFRDLKPSNVMLTHSGEIKLIDFGIARFFKAGQSADTQAIGTPGYAAPEQHGAGQTDARSDVYSLGVLLHYLLTLHDPGATPFALPPVRQLNPQVTPEMERLIERATQVQASQRYGSMDELRLALTPGATTNLPPPSPIGAVLSSPLLLAGLIALILLVAAGWVFGQQWINPPAAPPPAAATVAVPPTEPAPTPLPPPTATSTPAAVAVPTLPPPTPTLIPSNIYIQYVLDASNSMVSSLPDGQARLDAARGALAQHWQSLTSHPHISLRAFGHRRPALDAASCLDTEMLVAFGQDQVEALSAALAGLTPQGISPVTAVLREASGDLGSISGRVDALILIADGGDNCGENPQQLLGFQREVGLRFPIYVAGLAVDDAARAQLRGMAEMTGGQYRDAANQVQLTQALDEFARQIASGAPR